MTVLVIGILCFEFVWNLEFEIWDFILTRHPLFPQNAKKADSSGVYPFYNKEAKQLCYLDHNGQVVPLEYQEALDILNSYVTNLGGANLSYAEVPLTAFDIAGNGGSTGNRD